MSVRSSGSLVNMLPEQSIFQILFNVYSEAEDFPSVIALKRWEIRLSYCPKFARYFLGNFALVL
jgi:hypothetical protein